MISIKILKEEWGNLHEDISLSLPGIDEEIIADSYWLFISLSEFDKKRFFNKYSEFILSFVLN